MTRSTRRFWEVVILLFMVHADDADDADDTDDTDDTDGF
jgi:hypothetical protein